MKLQTTTGLPPESPDEIIVPDSQIRQRRHLSGYVSDLNGLHGEGNWDDEEVRALIQQKEFKKFQQAQLRKVEPVKVDECINKYLATFDNVTPNDLESLKQLCQLEAQHASLLVRLDDELARPTLDALELDKVFRVQDMILKRHGEIQRSLGIARSKRTAKEQRALEAVLERIDAGREWVQEQLTQLIHCNILHGWYLYHFEELPFGFWFRCAKCGEKIEIESGDIKNLIAVLDDKYQTALKES